MSVAIVQIPFQTELLQQVDRFVDDKKNSRVDVILEATRMYVARKQNWQNMFALGDRLALKNNLSEADFIISGDNDLLSLKEFQGIPILTASEYIALQFSTQDES